MPGRGNRPAMWLLGSSGYSAQVAGLLGLPFAFAHHFSAVNTLPRWPCTASGSARRRSSSARTPWSPPRSSAPRPTSGPASWPAPARCRSCACAGPSRRGALPQEAAAYPYSEVERAFIDDRQATQIIGSPQTVRAGMASLLDATAADELMITTMVYDPADRLRSFELVADLARSPQLPPPGLRVAQRPSPQPRAPPSTPSHPSRPSDTPATEWHCHNAQDPCRSIRPCYHVG